MKAQHEKLLTERTEKKARRKELQERVELEALQLRFSKQPLLEVYRSVVRMQALSLKFRKAAHK